MVSFSRPLKVLTAVHDIFDKNPMDVSAESMPREWLEGAVND